MGVPSLKMIVIRVRFPDTGPFGRGCQLRGSEVAKEHIRTSRTRKRGTMASLKRREVMVSPFLLGEVDRRSKVEASE